jgi:hypothetical protein
MKISYILVLVAILFVFAGSTSIAAGKKIGSITITNGSIRSVHKFGYVDGATKCIDPSLDEEELPPKPPQGLFDARFREPSCPSDMLGMMNDYHGSCNSPGTKDTFYLDLQSGDLQSPMVISWHPDSLRQFGKLIMKDPYTGKLIHINMHKDSSLTLPPNSPISTVLIISYCTKKNIQTSLPDFEERDTPGRIFRGKD